MPSKRWAFAAAGLMLWAWAPGGSAASSVDAQPGNPFIIDVWTMDEGLPQNTVTSIVKSHDGYLWFGTLDGLVRFDGAAPKGFTTFDETKNLGLDNSWIVQLFEDREGQLWVGTETAGVVLLKDGRFVSQGIGKGMSEQRLAAACQDRNGAVWLYTADGQLWRYLKGVFNTFTVDRGRRSLCRALIAESSGPVWVGTDARQDAIGPNLDPGSLDLPVAQSLPVGRLDYLLSSPRGGYWRLANGRVRKIAENGEERDLEPYAWSRSINVTSACEDPAGNLWVGTRGAGMYEFATDGKVLRLSTQEGLSSDVILSLYADPDGSLWVGTDAGGLNRVKRRVFEVANGSAGMAVQSVCEDAAGGLWIASNGNGLIYSKGDTIKKYDATLGLEISSIWSVYVDRQQRVWAGTWRQGGAGLFRLQDGQFQSVSADGPGVPAALSGNIHAIYQDRHTNLWVGTQSGLARWDEREWTMFTTANELSANDVQAITDDNEGNLWIGTAGGGLNRLRDGKFKAYHKQDGLPSENVSSLYMDGDGVLWIGTLGGGLGRFDGVKWTRYTKSEGLSSNSIGYLVEDGQEDGQSYLWIGSLDGIMRVQKKDLNEFARKASNFIRCRVYHKLDGLPTRECTVGSQPGGCVGRGGRVWLPTAKGVVSVDPRQLHSNAKPPPAVIVSLLIDNVPVTTNALVTILPQPVIVPPGKEHLEIHYTSINLAASDEGLFRFRLQNHELQWTEAGASRVAHYSSLPPGHYFFQVQACNEDGVWDTVGCSLELIVQPPIWRTWWFLSASAAGLIGMIVAVVHYLSTQKLQRELARLAQQDALEKERARIAQDIHDQLGASLTQVSLLGELLESDKDSPQEVEAHARQISQTARETTRVLDEIVWAVNPSNDTLDGLVTYACKYAQEYLSVAGLRYRLDVPEQLPGTVIPPEFRHNVFLTFKEAITNVVRHAGATSVWVRLRLGPGTFVLEIQDDGRGIVKLDEKVLRARNGLRGMTKRMEAIGGSFSFEPAPERGTLARLTAPLRNDEVSGRPA
jgi:ligand-binding sensor domain-containing protein/signal transduction histidine kinase